MFTVHNILTRVRLIRQEINIATFLYNTRPPKRNIHSTRVFLYNDTMTLYGTLILYYPSTCIVKQDEPLIA